MVIVNCEQNTDEWYQSRLGIPTASCFEKIINVNGSRSKQREKYLYQLAGEKVTGEPCNGYYNANMERGHERERESREMYEFMNDVTVETPGFVYYDQSKQFGCSPDGLVGKDGGFETKDASPHIHLHRLENGWSKAQHFQQIQGCLYITGRKWWDLVSYSRGFKPLVVRFEPDEKFIKSLIGELSDFIHDLHSIVEKYRV